MSARPASLALERGGKLSVPPGRPPRPYPWRGRAWADMPKWQRLCAVLESEGPKTTGELGHIKGIGENIRGIRREANVHLRTMNMEIISETTWKRDAQGEPIANATYRLVDSLLAKHLKRTVEKIEGLRGRQSASTERGGTRIGSIGTERDATPLALGQAEGSGSTEPALSISGQRRPSPTPAANFGPRPPEQEPQRRLF